MKKTVMIFVIALVVGGLAASASAFGPGWQNGYRHSNPGHYQRAHYQHENYRHGAYRAERIVVVPVRQAQPVVRVQQPARTGVFVSTPHFGMWFR